MVGQAFREHYFPGLNDGGNSKKQPMCGTIGEDDPARIDINRQIAQPIPRDSTMSVQSRYRTAGAHETCIVRLAQFFQQAARGILVRFGIDRPNDRQIRRSARITIEHEPVRALCHPVADICSPPNLAAQITTSFSFLITDTDGLHRKSELVSQVPMRRHTHGGLKNALFNIIDNFFRQKSVLGDPLAHFQHRFPHASTDSIMTY